MPRAASQSAELDYRVRGSGPDTLLLIMGLGGHASEWGERLPERLAERYRVVSFDNRGIGDSTTGTPEWTMQDMAADACAVLDAVGAESAHVLGLSMGGMIAQTLALDHPSRVHDLVLLSTTGGGVGTPPAEPRAQKLFERRPGLSPEQIRRETLETIMAPSFVRAHPEVIEHLVRLRLDCPTHPKTFMVQFSACLNSDRRERLPQIDRRTLVIHGTEDCLLPVDNGIALSRAIPGARLELIEDCGHMPMWEHPDHVADLVLDFLS